MVERIYGGKGLGPLNETRGSQKIAADKQTGKSQRGDRVEFSDVLQQASQTGKTQGTAHAARAEKLQTLKQQIANGEYRPDLEKVAARLLKFIVEEES